MHRSEQTESYFGEEVFDVTEVENNEFVLIIQQIKGDVDEVFGGCHEELEGGGGLGVGRVVEFSFLDQDDGGDL